MGVAGHAKKSSIASQKQLTVMMVSSIVEKSPAGRGSKEWDGAVVEASVNREGEDIRSITYADDDTYGGQIQPPIRAHPVCLRSETWIRHSKNT